MQLDSDSIVTDGSSHASCREGIRLVSRYKKAPVVATTPPPNVDTIYPVHVCGGVDNLHRALRIALCIFIFLSSERPP